MHQVLYRKWRPRTFSEVYGQEHITSILRHEVASGKTAHAYLFCGSRGTGKTTCAKLLARAVNCLDPHDGEPCGVCPICVGIENGTITDVLEMDAASNNGVDDIRAIRDEVVYSPASAKYRVYIIDEVHMLSVSAFNALLKTLEEPPAQVLFILATTELQKLPPTIVSRCRRFDFRRISQQNLSDRLHEISAAEGISLEADAALLIAKAAAGGMRDAISLLELCAAGGKPVTDISVRESLGIVGREMLERIAEAILDGQTDALFDAVSEMYASARDIGSFWQDLTAYYRDMLVIRTTPDAQKYLDLTNEEYTETAALATRYTLELILWICTQLDEAYASMQRGVVSKRLCAEMTLVRMARKMDDSSAALAARLSVLEDKLARGIPSPSLQVQKAQPAVQQPPSPAPSLVASSPPPPPTAEKKILRSVPWWIEAVHKYEKADMASGAFLNGSQAFRADGSDTLTVRVSSSFAAMMLERNKAVLLDIVAGFDEITEIIFSTSSKKDAESALPIDELEETIRE